jgi:hypothetical protein
MIKHRVLNFDFQYLNIVSIIIHSFFQKKFLTECLNILITIREYTIVRKQINTN